MLFRPRAPPSDSAPWAVSGAGLGVGHLENALDLGYRCRCGRAVPKDLGVSRGGGSLCERVGEALVDDPRLKKNQDDLDEKLSRSHAHDPIRSPDHSRPRIPAEEGPEDFRN